MCALKRGAVAQLGERRVRNAEVVGSTPICSTTISQSPLRAVPRSLYVWALAALLLATMLFATRGLNLAVEFTGGFIVDARAPAGLTSVEDALIDAGIDDFVLKRVSGQPSDVIISVPQREALLAPQSASLLAQQLASALKQRDVEVNRIDVIAPSVGRELLRDGAIPPILAFVVAVIYSAVRHGTRYALSAAAVTLGAMAIALGLVLSAYIVFRLEFSLSSLVAVDGLAILAAVIGAVSLPRLPA